MSVAPVMPESDALLVALDKGLARLRRCDLPCTHAVAADIFDDLLARQLLQAACGMQWHHSHSSWHSFLSARPSVAECQSASPAAGLTGPRAREIMRMHIGRTFARQLASKVQFSVLRLEEGHWIGTHNDSPAPDGCSHCLVFAFSSAKPNRGGEFVLMRFDRTGRKRDEVIAGHHNSAIAIEMSAHSFHRVGRVYEGPCYFLVFSFWLGDAADERRPEEASSR